MNGNIYGGDWYEGAKRKCPICKKTFRCTYTWAYRMGYKSTVKYYCSWKHLRQAQREHAEEMARKDAERKKKAEAEARKREKEAKKAPRRFTPEIEAKIYRRYLEGAKATDVAREIGTNHTSIYARYKKWRNEKNGDHEEGHPA